MKRTILAILLVFALSVSVFALVACDQHTHTYSEDWTYNDTQHWHEATCEHAEDDLVGDLGNHQIQNGQCSVCGYQEPKAEYSISFNNQGGTEIATVTTVNQKISAEEFAKVDAMRPDLGDGYQFLGWFERGAFDNDLGDYVYEVEFDINKTYTKNTDYYAVYDYLPLSGLEQGYTVIGVINGYTCWTPGEEPEEWMMVQDATEGWIYRVTVDVIGGDQIKVKEKSDQWRDQDCNLGFDGLADVVLKDGIEANIKDHDLMGGDIECLVWGSASSGSNVYISLYIESANITVEYNYRTGMFTFIINEIVVLDEIPEFYYILVGGFDDSFGGSWNASNDNEKVRFVDSGDGNNFSISFAFIPSQQWKITYSDGSWDWQLTAENIASVTGASVVVPEDAFTDGGGNDHNIVANYACEVTITINIQNKTIAIVVNSITVIGEGESLWPDAGYAIVGNFGVGNTLGSDGGAYYWKLPAPDNKFVFTRVGQTDVGVLEIDLIARTQFKVAQNIAGYVGEIGWMDEMKIFGATGVSVPDGLFKDLKGNIEVWADCKVKISIYVTKAPYIEIEVLSVGEIKQEGQITWIIAGSMNGWATQTTNSAYMLKDNGDGTHTITLTLNAGDSFKIKKNSGTWDGDYGYFDIENVDTTYFAASGQYGSDIGVNKACTVTITFKTNTSPYKMEIAIIS